MFVDNSPVLVIVVADRQWNAYGPDTLAHRALLETLYAMGGINEGVSAGTYHFTIDRTGPEPVASLTPFED